MGFDLGVLGVKKNVPRVNFLEYTGILEAPEKFGKTAFSTLYPNSVLLAAERGYMAQVLNVKDINSWDDFVEFINLLEENREDIGEDIQTIIIDTVDELYPMAASYVVRKQSIIDKKKYFDIKDIPYGQGWGKHDEEFKKQVKRILGLGFAILYLTHSTVKTIKPKDGEPYDVYKSTMSDRCANIVLPACDYIIHGEYRKIEVSKGVFETKRVLTTRTDGGAVAGNRVFFEEDIIFDTEEEAMEKFQKAFREGIERNLAKGGINTSVEELSETQKQEREEEVKNYIETSDISVEKQIEILKKDIKEQTDKMTTHEKKKFAPSIKKITGGNADFSVCEDVEQLQTILNEANSFNENKE